MGYETNDDYVAVGYNVDDGDTATDSDGNITVMGQSQTQQVDDPCNSLATWIQCGEDTQAFPIYKGELDGNRQPLVLQLWWLKIKMIITNGDLVGNTRIFTDQRLCIMVYRKLLPIGKFRYAYIMLNE